MMPPFLRKINLTAHITSSVGWFGSVFVFLVLSIVGLTGQDTQMVSAAYLAMNVTAWFAILPMCLIGFTTGVLQALGTEWGLARHYWVLAKLLLTAISTFILLLKMKLIGHLADVAAGSSMLTEELRQARTEIVIHAGGGLIVLFAIIILSIFKPWGRTRFWKSKQKNSLPDMTKVHQEDLQTPMKGTLVFNSDKMTKRFDGVRSSLKVFIGIIGAIIVGSLVLHLSGMQLDH